MTPSEIKLRGEVATAGARLRPHSSSALMGLYGAVARWFGVRNFVETFWLTLGTTIYHPNHLANPLADERLYTTIRHELVHVRQQRTGLVGWVVRYLTSQKFRWEAEREAYLLNVRDGDSPAWIAHQLHVAYKIDQPSEVAMERWLQEHA